MSKPILTYEIENGKTGKQKKYYAYRMYKRPFYSLKEKYYMEVETLEDGERKVMTSDIKVHSCTIEELFGRICFKPFMVIEKEKHADEIQKLNADERLQNYFAWDTHVFLEDSYFKPENNGYHFMVSAWNLNHVSACRRFLLYSCGESIENSLPKAQNESLIWIVTPDKAELRKYDTLHKKTGETVFTHPNPQQLFLLMASNNVFRHFFDWYAIVTG